MKNMYKKLILSLFVGALASNICFALDVPVTQTPPQPLTPDKKGLFSILTPKPISNSLTKRIKAYNTSYQKTFTASLQTLSLMGFKINSFDSAKGEIDAVAKDKKRYFVLIVPVQDQLTLARITPADGVYSAPQEYINEFFNNINLQLKQIN